MKFAPIDYHALTERYHADVNRVISAVEAALQSVAPDISPFVEIIVMVPGEAHFKVRTGTVSRLVETDRPPF